MIDLEPRVINVIQKSVYSNLFNPENVFISKEGGGAGNTGAKVIAKERQCRKKFWK